MAKCRYLRLYAIIISLPVCLYFIFATVLSRGNSQGPQVATDFKALNSTDESGPSEYVASPTTADSTAHSFTKGFRENPALNVHIGSQAADFPASTPVFAELSSPTSNVGSQVVADFASFNSTEIFADHSAHKTDIASQPTDLAALSATKKVGEHSILKSFMARVRKFCGEHNDTALRPKTSPASSKRAMRFGGSVMVQVKPTGGFGNGILFLESAVMVAWLTRRPIVFISDMQHLLRSPYLPDDAYIKNSHVLDAFALPKVRDEKEAYALLHEGRDGSRPNVRARYKVKLRISGISGKEAEVWVDPLQKESQWNIPSDGSSRALLVQSVIGPDVWTERSVHFGHDLARAAQVRDRMRQLNPDLEHVHKCALHYALGWPGHALLRQLKRPFDYISNSQVLVAIHVRMGDAYMQKETHGGTPHKSAHSDARMSYDKLSKYFSKVNVFLDVLSLKVKPRQVVVFIASDTERTMHIAKKHLSSNLTIFTTAGKPVHTNAEMFKSKEGHHTEEEDGRAKAAADWYMLALSNILLSPTKSTFSITASHLGMQHLAVLGKSVNQDHIEKLNQMNVNKLL